MTLAASRFQKAASQVHRFPELIRCFRYFDSPLRIATAFATQKSSGFPFTLCYRRNSSRYDIEIRSWQDLTTAWVVLLGGEYRIEKKDRRIVDLGANIGLFAIYVNSINPGARILSVEPFPDTYQSLVNNVERLELGSRVTTRQLAISNLEGAVRFDSSPDIPSYCRQIAKEDNSSQQIEVPSRTLDSFFNELEFDEIDFVKVDIEGAEYDVFESASEQTLRRSKRYGVEYHSAGLDPIEQKFEKAGFRLTYQPKAGSSGVAEFTRF